MIEIKSELETFASFFESLASASRSEQPPPQFLRALPSKDSSDDYTLVTRCYVKSRADSNEKFEVAGGLSVVKCCEQFGKFVTSEVTSEQTEQNEPRQNAFALLMAFAGR